MFDQCFFIVQDVVWKTEIKKFMSNIRFSSSNIQSMETVALNNPFALSRGDIREKLFLK